VPALRSFDSCRQAVFLKATERIVVIKHETDFHGAMRAVGDKGGNAKSGSDLAFCRILMNLHEVP